MINETIIVIGAGAGGMMAAGRAAELGAKVKLLEKTGDAGKKMLISGKNRCNVTNSCELEDFIEMFGPNGRFLYHSFHHYFRDDITEFLHRYGVDTKIERGGRIFPASDDSRDVIAAFRKYLNDHGVEVVTNCCAQDIIINNGKVEAVRTTQGVFPAGAVILATGGASYPATGSNGDGYRMAEALGHTIVKLRPALVPLVVKEIELAKSMQGVSLRNVRLTAFQSTAAEIDPSLTPVIDFGRGITRKPKPPIIESLQGEMLFTHFGIGGPITLRMSLAIVDRLSAGPVSVSIDLKPALGVNQVRLRLQRDFDAFPKRSYSHLLKGLLPQKMILPFISLTDIPETKLGNQINAEEKERLVQLLKSLRFNIKSPLPLTSAMVTAGGVSLSNVDPRSMASKLIGGLFFCGEVLDLDAETGGFNLQAAFSTGVVAGEGAIEFLQNAVK